MHDPNDLAKMQYKELWTAFDEAEGEEKLELYGALKDRLWDMQDYNTIIGLSDRMCALAVELGDPVTAGLHKFTQASANFNLESFQEAAIAYGIAADFAAETGNQSQLAERLLNKADSYFSLEDYENSLTTSKEAATIAEAESLEKMAGNCMYTHAKSLYLLDRDEEAIDALEDARNHFRNAGEAAWVADVDAYRVRILNYHDRYDEALPYLRSSLIVWQTLKNTNWEAFINFRLAENLRLNNNETESIPYYEVAIARYSEIEKFAEIPKCELGLGRAYLQLDDYANAIQHLVQASALADANGAEWTAYEADSMRAIALHNDEQFEAAKQLNLKLLATLEKKGDTKSIENAYPVRARAADNALAQENWAEALSILENTPSLGEFVPSTGWLLWRMQIQARALYKLGREDEALVVADSALKITTEEFVSSVTGHFYEIRGLVLNHKNKREGKRDLAHAIALHLANNLDNRARDLAEHFMPSEGDPFDTDNSITNSTGVNEVEPMKKGRSSSEKGS
jgi:tetratricopeptide (TPR) repeat protein